MRLNKVLLKPLVTEKSTQAGQNSYAFVVTPEASKTQIKEAVEKNFGVKVVKVRTLKKEGKTYRVGRYRQPRKRQDLKKAIVQLKEDDKIEVFESLKET